MFRSSGSLLYKSLAVWGGGTMGGGIAQVAAQSNIAVTIVDVSQERLDVSRRNIEMSLARIAKKKCEGDEAKMKAMVDGVLKNITFTTDEKAAAASELVVEAIVEDIAVKKELFARLDKLAPKETVFCSNTSSLSITEMASATGRADRFAGLHFFSPVPMMKLVEVVRTDKVEDSVVQNLVEFVKTIKKTPAVAKDTPGFIVNRLLVPYQLEACRLVERGVASCEDVDTAMKLGCGYPMGPFELADSVGIDVLWHIQNGWHKEFPEETLFQPSKLIDERMKAGKLGRKSGEGFYKYDKSGKRIQ